MALPEIRSRGPGDRPSLMALRTAVSAEPAPLGAHVPFRGVPCHEVVARREQGQNGPLRHGFFDGLQVFIAGVQEQMHMHVDEAG